MTSDTSTLRTPDPPRPSNAIGHVGEIATQGDPLMRNALLLLLAGTIGAPGCIIYDDTQTLETEDDRTLERDERDQIEEEDDGLASEFDLYVTPNEAEAGETFIASVRTATEHSLLDVTGVKLYGEVELLAEDYRDFELLLTLQVDDNATGDIDVVVEFSDGSAAWLDAALSIFEAGSDHQAGSSQEDDTEDSQGDEPTDGGDC
jgi:hypothetical protein